ncbi:MAG: hypothetical protein IJX71_02040 [Oscillospiraceae bacterium]|nr:hypothetical protein [Oscillospiraceae bacterium]
MKKLLPLLALLLVLTACGPKPAADTPDEPESPTEITAEPEEEPSPELDYESIRVGDGLYNLSLLPELEELDMVDGGLISDTKLLLLTGLTGDTLRVLDLETGELTLLCELELVTEQDQQWANTDLKSLDPIVVVDYYHETSFLISETGEVLYTLPRADYWAFSRTGCVRYGEGSEFYQFDFDTGKERSLGSLPVEYLYPTIAGYTADGDELVLEVTSTIGQEEVTLVMDVGTGKIAASYRGWNLYPALSGKVSFDADNDAPEYDTEPADTFTLTARQEDEGGVKQVTEQVKLSDLAPNGTADLMRDWLYGAGNYDFWGIALAELWLEDELNYILWDYSGQSPEETGAAVLEPYELPRYDLGEIGERAETMSRQYGVQIYVGEAVLNAPFPDYTLSACEDPVSLSNALDVLEEAFSVYPEGYLEQLGGDHVREICFYLSGTMTPNDPSVSIENPAGLACQVEDLELIAMNAGGVLQAQDVIHELTHVLDHWLDAENILDEEQWSSMNPEGFDYYYAYIDENGESYEFAGDDTYTSWDSPAYEGKVDTIYFVDPYSTTYPTEDRARLMEYLLMYPEDAVPSLFESTHVQDKLEYYFLCIRAVCDTESWTEKPLWEVRLEQAAAQRE